MYKKVILAILLISASPGLANATWYVTASASRSSGDTTSRVSPAGSTAIPGFNGFRNVSTIAGSGFQVNKVTIDGISQTLSPANYYTVSYVAGKTYRTFVAYFGPATVSGSSITVTPDAHTSYKVTAPVNGSLTNITKGDSRTIAIIPYSGYKVGTVAVSPDVCTVADSVTYLGAKDVTCSNIQNAIAITVGNSPVSQTVTANAGPDRTVNGTGAGYAISLGGSATYTIGPVSYAWSAVGANAGSAHFGSPASASTTFYADASGTYTVQLVATAAGPTVSEPSTAVIIVLNTAAYLESLCSSCHASRNATVVADYDISRHKTATSRIVVCQTCHDPTNSGHYTIASPVDSCGGCHFDASGNVPSHPVVISGPCMTCHNAHSTIGMPRGTHFNNITSSGYPASYVTSRATCADCHYDSAANASRRGEWRESGHASINGLSWKGNDFKTMGGCVQCHTTTGFIAYSTGRITSAWGDAADKTKEVLTCKGCHKDISTGVVRMVAPVRPYADDTYVNRDLGKSNICMVCHSGRNNGASITAQLGGQADFTNMPFIDPHYHASGGTLHGKAGYHFHGPTTYAFYSTNSHRQIGIADANGTGTSGPCVACHRNSSNAHTNRALVNTLCGNCHGTSLDPERLNSDKQAYINALAVLNAMLAAKGHPYSPSDRFSSNSNWGTGQAGADTMGAAFNYAMLLNEPGAYAHNSAYAKQLLVDSIDYLYNGEVTGSIDTALAGLVRSEAITQGQADSLATYKAASSCTVCHANASGSHTAHLNKGILCSACHSATAVTNTTLVSGSNKHLNGVTDVEAGAGVSFNYASASSGGTCSSISCHNKGTATWGGTLGCDGCHDAPPATASHLKHYGGSIAQAGYGNTGIARDITPNATGYIMNCGNCHPVDASKHGNGVVDVELYNPQAPTGSLKALNPSFAGYSAGPTVFTDARDLPYTNGTCSSVYCHSYNTRTTTALVPENDPDWQSKLVTTRVYKAVTWGGAPLGCSGCHGNPTQTAYPANDGGAGDSHSWIDAYGYQNLHTWNMGFEPVSCRYCHNDTVKQVNAFTEDGMGVRTLGEVPISNYSKHVNGSNDVSFDKQNPFVYKTYYSGDVSMSLVNSTYDPVTKNCSNVSCHREQTTVKWGTPYRWDTNECDRCHGYSN